VTAGEGARTITQRGDVLTRRADPRTFGPLKTVAFSTILIVLFFGVLEGSVRVWVYFFRAPAERFDLATGTFILVPGVYTRINAPPIQVNSRGFVGPEFQEPRPPGIRRIVALGDSCTFGQGTGVETYPAQLSRRLNGGSEERRVQVINAGIEGMNTQLGLRRLTSKVAPLRPDILTVYLGWNDLMKFEPGGQVEQPGLAVVARVMDQLWLVKGMRKLVFYYIRPRIRAPATGPTSRTGVFRDYRPARFEDNLRSIIDAGRNAGAQVVLLTMPSVVSDDMTAEDLRRANVVFPYYASAYAVGDFVDLIAAYNRSVRTVAAAENVVLVDLASEIDRRPDRRSLFLDTMHPNQVGRELIADILARHLRAHGLLGS
jgi:lysophospholipase L1-like esterase